MKIILFQFVSYFPYSKMKIETFIRPAGICKTLEYCKTLESKKLLNKRHQRKTRLFLSTQGYVLCFFIHWLIVMLDIFRSWRNYNWEVRNLCRLHMGYWLPVWCPTPCRVTTRARTIENVTFMNEIHEWEININLARIR